MGLFWSIFLFAPDRVSVKVAVNFVCFVLFILLGLCLFYKTWCYSVVVRFCFALRSADLCGFCYVYISWVDSFRLGVV